MRTESKHTIGKHIFTVIVPAHVNDFVKSYKAEDYDPEKSLECSNCKGCDDSVCEDYSRLYDMTKNISSDDDYLDCKVALSMDGKFNEECVDFIKNFDVAEAIESIPKKKNGTFRKGAVQHVVLSPLGYLSEEEYGYRRDVLRWKVLDDLTAELQFTSYVDKW